MNDMQEQTLWGFAKPPGEVDPNEPTQTWEELISSWMTVRELSDVSNWTLGDIANEVERAFGRSKDSLDGMRPLDHWAIAVGEKPDTVRQYAWVSRTFPLTADRTTGLSWSHYRAAVKTGDAAMAWIEEAIRNEWTVARLAEEIKNVSDATAVTDGKPCTDCGALLPEDGAYHVRRNGKVDGSFCSAICIAHHYSLVGTAALVEDDPGIMLQAA